jgi:hypothetical protein
MSLAVCISCPGTGTQSIEVIHQLTITDYSSDTIQRAINTLGCSTSESDIDWYVLDRGLVKL